MTKFRYRKDAFIYSLILLLSIKSPIILGSECRVKGFSTLYVFADLGEKDQNLGEKTIKGNNCIEFNNI